jgi:phytol kinase
MNEWIGMVLGFGYITVIIVLAVLMSKWPHEMGRTFAHIMVANWWIIASLTMKSYWIVMAAPLFFILFNTLNLIFDWIPSLNSKTRSGTFGTIYYAASVALLVQLYFFDPALQVAGALGILIMGYGDGMAAVIGQFFGKHKFTIFKGHKTWEGSLTMWLVSTIVVAATLYFTTPAISWPMVILIPFLATLIEAISPYGLDNLFVPLITALIYFVYIF